jgi:hypothetical protein
MTEEEMQALVEVYLAGVALESVGPQDAADELYAEADRLRDQVCQRIEDAGLDLEDVSAETKIRAQRDAADRCILAISNLKLVFGL